ncbi:MAG: metallophosphoesterase [Deltaproteobacteria bacterium]|nr:metallophosphoesterase [Deltaproteobacteria bacterium]
MKLLFTSDIHASNTHLFSMLSTAEKEMVDVLIMGGDLIPHYLPETKKFGMLRAQAMYLEDIFIPAVMNFKGRSDTIIYLDLGNDDFGYNRKILEKYNGKLFNLLHFERHSLTDEVDIIGYMIVPPTPFKIKDWEKPDSLENPCMRNNRAVIDGFISLNGILEEYTLDFSSNNTIKKDLNEISKMIKKPFIFISHSPPYNCPLDMIQNGLNVGSISIRRFIEEWAGKGLLVAAFHGHIHESPMLSGSISTNIGGTICVSPGQGTGPGAEFRYIIFNLSGDRISFDFS